MCAPQPIRFGVARDWLESATFYISIYLLQSVSRIMSPSLQLHINSETVPLTAILFKATQLFAVAFFTFFQVFWREQQCHPSRSRRRPRAPRMWWSRAREWRARASASGVARKPTPSTSTRCSEIHNSSKILLLLLLLLVLF